MTYTMDYSKKIYNMLHDICTWFSAFFLFWLYTTRWPSSRAGASTRFTSTSTSTSTCNMCEYEYEYEYLIITWVRVRVRVLVDEYEYKYEYRSMINILYSMYRQQIFIVWSLTRESSGSYKPGTTAHCPCKLSLSIYICLIILCNLIQWHFNVRSATYWLSWLT